MRGQPIVRHWAASRRPTNPRYREVKGAQIVFGRSVGLRAKVLDSDAGVRGRMAGGAIDPCPQDFWRLQAEGVAPVDETSRNARSSIKVGPYGLAGHRLVNREMVK